MIESWVLVIKIYVVILVWNLSFFILYLNLVDMVFVVFIYSCLFNNESFFVNVGGVCGYGNFYLIGYGISIVVFSLVLFNSGFFCGVCYEFICDIFGFKYCFFGNLFIILIVINYCF